MSSQSHVAGAVARPRQIGSLPGTKRLLAMHHVRCDRTSAPASIPPEFVCPEHRYRWPLPHLGGKPTWKGASGAKPQSSLHAGREVHFAGVLWPELQVQPRRCQGCPSSLLDRLDGCLSATVSLRYSGHTCSHSNRLTMQPLHQALVGELCCLVRVETKDRD